MDRYKQDGKKLSDVGKYIQTGLVVLIILIGMKFVFARSADVFGPRDGRLSQIALEYYVENYGDDGQEVRAVVRNFGCHQEIHIYKDGELVMKVTYANGQVYEL
ncbi:hypothetical protein [Clostridium formicaceticum]|uniref:Uncharacterized protein n=1 Tax=Clostridium formicaceticum TaxID=1497 RepID=A0AAC9RL64_9CLOT|nr:hypothetical protein [Clostridium formicaceticum]AOY77468.1 hypothetical protein BJL90_17375 [Clostridium formicaceticum]ARE88031.1 hypothetical protein CLFO_24320 [Clostridium formicaceticum]